MITKRQTFDKGVKFSSNLEIVTCQLSFPKEEKSVKQYFSNSVFFCRSRVTNNNARVQK